MAKQNKKRSKFPLFILIIIIIAVLGLLWKFGYLKGFGKGSGEGASTKDQSIERASAEASKAEQEIITIEVSGDTYSWNGSKVDLQEIQENLNQLSDQAKITLIDHQAIQNAYQSVLDLLNEQGVAFDQINKPAE